MKATVSEAGDGGGSAWVETPIPPDWEGAAGTTASKKERATIERSREDLGGRMAASRGGGKPFAATNPHATVPFRVCQVAGSRVPRSVQRSVLSVLSGYVARWAACSSLALSCP